MVKAEFVPDGRKVEVNTQTFTGPVHVVRRAILKEISFVDFGADTNTSAKVAVKENEQDIMEGNDTKTVETTEGKEGSPASSCPSPVPVACGADRSDSLAEAPTESLSVAFHLQHMWRIVFSELPLRPHFRSWWTE